jgi:radical SAM superfamily enzyme YgiQ (UPF0313 family)
MKLLLMNPPNLEKDTTIATQPFSLGLLILYNMAKNHGYEVDLINCRDLVQLQNIDLKQYTLVGMPCYSRQRYSVFKTIDYIKSIAPNVLVFIGGSHVLDLEIEILNRYHNCDFIISKEGEIPLIKLLAEINGTHNYSNVPNLTWRSENLVVKNNVKYHTELDDLPFPYYHTEYLEDYTCYSRGGLYFTNHGLIAAVSLSRGCNNQCVFCANQASFGEQRYFSFEYSTKLLTFLYEKHQVKTLHFVDDDFCSDRQRIVDLCDFMMSNNLNIQWRCSTRATNIDVELVEHMIAAGCKMISILNERSEC